jgi:glyoxylase-like metal-dependent hydrolase (beta-lactamase superfamily II)
MIALPASMRVFERGWLSSNNVFFIDETHAALVDSGYATHAPQTLALVRQALGNERTLDLIVNTHLQFGPLRRQCVAAIDLRLRDADSANGSRRRA